MTDIERAIAVFNGKLEWEKEKRYPFISKEEVEAYKLAIKVLEQEPSGDTVPMSVIEDIKADIAEEKECAYADFERYKIEYLGVDEETVMDELPNDDFRYGMERCLEIINKYSERSE